MKTFYFVVFLMMSFSLYYIVAFISHKLQEAEDLKEFRRNLKRGSKVKVRGMEDPQIVYVNMYHKVILNMYEKRDWYKSVRMEDVFPWEEEHQLEVI